LSAHRKKETRTPTAHSFYRVVTLAGVTLAEFPVRGVDWGQMGWVGWSGQPGDELFRRTFIFLWLESDSWSSWPPDRSKVIPTMSVMSTGSPNRAHVTSCHGKYDGIRAKPPCWCYHQDVRRGQHSAVRSPFSLLAQLSHNVVSIPREASSWKVLFPVPSTRTNVSRSSSISKSWLDLLLRIRRFSLKHSDLLVRSLASLVAVQTIVPQQLMPSQSKSGCKRQKSYYKSGCLLQLIHKWLHPLCCIGGVPGQWIHPRFPIW